MTHYKKSLLIAVLIGWLGLFLHTPVLADKPAIEMTISPAKTKIDLAAGQNYSGSFKVINSGQDSFKFKVYATPYQIKDEAYTQPDFVKETPRTQLSRWVKFEQTEYSIKPEQTLEIKYQVKVPTNIPDGGQYAVLMAETISKNDAMINSIKRIGMIIYGHTDGQTIEQGTATINQPSFFNFGAKVNSIVDFNNTGNTDFDGTIKTEIFDLFDNLKQDQEKSFTVLPETNRKARHQWSNQPKIGLYKVKITASFLDQTTTKTAWILFISPILVLALGLLIIAIIIKQAFEKKNHGKKIKNY